MNKLILAIFLVLTACNTKFDTDGDSTDTSIDTSYEGARIRQPDAGWRAFIREP
jgi:hypothetical protein